VIQLLRRQIEDALHEIDCVCRFAALAALPIDALPDETTILKFRHWLEKHNLTAILLNATNIRSKFWRGFCQ